MGITVRHIHFQFSTSLNVLAEKRNKKKHTTCILKQVIYYTLS